VVEESIVVERRLILKEEVRIRRLHIMERHQETVPLRKQEAVITRIEPHNSELQEK
jgi:stress response protein YsnF